MSNVALCVPLLAISSTNAYSLQQATHVAYQIARAATAYRVAEVVVFQVKRQREKTLKIVFTEEPNEELVGDGMLLALLLQFFITPPYLVKSIFDERLRKQFAYAKRLPTLHLPYMGDTGKFREGLTVRRKSKKKRAMTKYVNIGRDKLLELARDVPVGVRVTIDTKSKTVVSPHAAYGAAGTTKCFGYHVRFAASFNAVFTELAVEGGYTAAVYVHANDYFGECSLPSVDKVGLRPLFVVGKMSDMESDGRRAADYFDGQLKIAGGMRTEDAVLAALTKLV